MVGESNNKHNNKNKKTLVVTFVIIITKVTIIELTIIANMISDYYNDVLNYNRYTYILYQTHTQTICKKGDVF